MVKDQKIIVKVKAEVGSKKQGRKRNIIEVTTGIPRKSGTDITKSVKALYKNVRNMEE